ncbi:MAG: nuclear transport factor 2 family protein, partial [Thermoleophilaceae bacterium]
MSHDRVELVRAFYSARAGGNLVETWNDDEWARTSAEALRHLADPDFEFVLVRGEAVAGDSYPGVDGLFAGMRAWLSHWDSYEIEPEELVLGDRVMVLTRERGVSKQARVPVVQAGAVVYTFKDGRVLRIET